MILLHGLGRTPVSFWRMHLALRRDGFHSLPIGYPTRRRGPPHQLASVLVEKLPRRGRLHFVGHSLGGLLALHLVATLPDSRRGRVVQLGTPNLGSEMAKRVRPLEPLFGPVLEALEPHNSPLSSPVEILSIAGSAAPEALSRVTGLKGPNDGVVSVESAHAAARPENRLTLPVMHTLMTMDSRVIDATIDFLVHGKLDPKRVAEGYD
ncbi:alpha/beta fold hydrolase [Oceanibium sediminis]|uniref:alpha/beta fold hydrolase n=1 Tax=Oceanibium sediminis TaxID=2026339 RepID=UPI0013007AFC|nr:alpha/beta fold hydrolase [Oceanibium sediminis]